MDAVADASRRRTGRAVVLGGSGVACGVVAAALGRRVVGLAPHATRVEELVELTVLAGGALVLAWLAGSALVASACLATRMAGATWRRGEAWVHRFAPELVRRALVVTVAVSLGVGPATAAVAAGPEASPSAVATVEVPGAALDLGWVVTSTAAPGTTTATAPATPTASASVDAPSAGTTPSPMPRPTPDPTTSPTSTGAAPVRASSGPPTTATPTAPAAAEPGRPTTPAAGGSTPDETTTGNPATVTVVRGDTLWGIAARHLPAGATDAQIAAAWPAWYAANAATIGPDAGLILPGQVLTVPAEVAA